MSGETRRTIRIEAESDAVLTRAIAALARFPREPRWALIGGMAVFLRLGSVTRPTQDADAVAAQQAALVDRLVSAGTAEVLSGGDLRVAGSDGQLVDVDVMDLNDDPLPGHPEARAFALARRMALANLTNEQITVVSPDGDVVVDANLPVASVDALVALKVVSMVRRPHGNHPEKVGSDIHDLVRLTAVGAQPIARRIVDADPALAAWIADQVERAFDRDLRYTLLRLRSRDKSPAASALADSAVGATVVLADQIRDLLHA